MVSMPEMPVVGFVPVGRAREAPGAQHDAATARRVVVRLEPRNEPRDRSCLLRRRRLGGAATAVDARPCAAAAPGLPQPEAASRCCNLPQ